MQQLHTRPGPAPTTHLHDVVRLAACWPPAVQHGAGLLEQGAPDVVAGVGRDGRHELGAHLAWSQGMGAHRRGPHVHGRANFT